MVGEIEGEVVVLVEPGATHNFISEKVVEKLWLKVVGTKEFEVALGNEVIVQGKIVCPYVMLNLVVLDVKENFFPSES